MKINFICKLFGHKWVYYNVGNDVRVCKTCHYAQEWKNVNPLTPTNKIWSWAIMYKELGASKYVEGYGKE